MTVVYDSGLLNDADGWTPAAATYDIHLFQNDFTPDRSSVLSDFTEADFPGYVYQAAGSYGGAYINGTGYAQADLLSPLLFQANTTFGGQTIYGFYATLSGDPTTVMGADRFSSPVTLTNDGDGVYVNVALTVRDLSQA